MLDETTTILTGGIIVILCVVALIISPFIFKSDIDPELAKQDLLNYRAEKFGKYIIHSRGIKDNYELTSISCPEGLWFYLSYRYDNIEITMQVIYYETTNDFHLKDGSFQQKPL